MRPRGINIFNKLIRTASETDDPKITRKIIFQLIFWGFFGIIGGVFGFFALMSVLIKTDSSLKDLSPVLFFITAFPFIIVGIQAICALLKITDKDIQADNESLVLPPDLFEEENNEDEEEDWSPPEWLQHEENLPWELSPLAQDSEGIEISDNDVESFYSLHDTSQADDIINDEGEEDWDSPEWLQHEENLPWELRPLTQKQPKTSMEWLNMSFKRIKKAGIVRFGKRVRLGPLTRFLDTSYHTSSTLLQDNQSVESAYIPPQDKETLNNEKENWNPPEWLKNEKDLPWELRLHDSECTDTNNVETVSSLLEPLQSDANVIDALINVHPIRQTAENAVSSINESFDDNINRVMTLNSFRAENILKTESPENNSKPFCKCGKEIIEESMFCPSCGRILK